MDTSDKNRFDRSALRVGELIQTLDALPGSVASASARELVQLVLELHGAALAQMMEAIGADVGGARLTATLLEDAGVSAALLLHGLHPEAIELRIRRAVDRLHPHLGVQGVAVESIDITGNAAHVRLRLGDAARYSKGSFDAIRHEIEAAIFDAAPDVGEIKVDGLPAHVSVIPVSSITVRRKSGSVAGACP